MKFSSTSSRARRGLAVLATATVLGGVVYGLGPGAANASSHREAPLVAADPAIDNTDLYAFVSPDRPDYVTFIANWQPFEEPNGGPNFYPFATDAAYNIYVDNDGDGKPDATFRYTFQTIDKRGNDTFLYNKGPVNSIDDPNLLVRQTYTLESSFNGQPFKTRIKDAPVAPSRVGPASMPDYGKLRDQASITLPGGWKSYAGQADDPFFLDLRVFDLLYGGNLSEVGQDTLAGYNVNTIALQVPFKDVALKGDAKRNPNIGIWTTTDRGRVRMSGQPDASDNARRDRVQVSRLGNPLVNEVVVPAGLKDAFNSLSPDKDAGIPAVVQRVTDPEVPRLIESIYKVPAPAAPRNDLVEIFLTGITTKAGGPIKADLNSQLNNADVDASKFRPSEMLRLNLSVPVSKNPNRLGLLAGDKVDANDNAFSDKFPYIALPNTAAVNAKAGKTGAAPAPAPSTTPAAFSNKDSTASTVGYISAGVGAAVVVMLGTAFLFVWWRRRTMVPADDTLPL